MPDAKMQIESYTGGVAQTNAFLLSCDEGVLIIDAPEGLHNFLIQQQKKVCGLFLTHGHFDHIWDASRIKDEFDCPVYYHKEDQPLFSNPQMMNLFGMSLDEIDPVVATKTLDEGDTLEVTPWKFDILHIPGHCPGSICLYEKSQHILFGGDVLFQGSIGRTDLPLCNHEALIDGIRKKLLPLPDKTRIYPGHGSETTILAEKKNNPFI